MKGKGTNKINVRYIEVLLYRGSFSLFYYHQINGENIHLAVRYTAATLLFKFLKD